MARPELGCTQQLIGLYSDAGRCITAERDAWSVGLSPDTRAGLTRSHSSPRAVGRATVAATQRMAGGTRGAVTWLTSYSGARRCIAGRAHRVHERALGSEHCERVRARGATARVQCA